MLKRNDEVLGRWRQNLLFAVIFSFLLKMIFAVCTVGTNDVESWMRFAKTIQEQGGLGLFHGDRSFIHPPFMIHFLRVIDFLATATQIPFSFWLRLPGILADVGTVWLIWEIVESRMEGEIHPRAVVWMALAPASIMISGFHGNSDPVMMFFVVLAVYCVGVRQWNGLGSLALGLSLNIKILPVIFLPAMILYLPAARERTRFVAGVVAMVLFGSLPYMIQEPEFILKQIFGYGSIPGCWGIPRLLGWLPSGWESVPDIYQHTAKYGIYLAILLISFFRNRRNQKAPLYDQLGLIAYLVVTFMPGFGVQYLAWLVPWLAIRNGYAAAGYYLASGVFLFLVYTFWSGGFPWYYASAGEHGIWRGNIIISEMICWMSVGGVLLLLVRNSFQPIPPIGKVEKSV